MAPRGGRGGWRGGGTKLRLGFEAAPRMGFEIATRLRMEIAETKPRPAPRTPSASCLALASTPLSLHTLRAPLAPHASEAGGLPNPPVYQPPVPTPVWARAGHGGHK